MFCRVLLALAIMAPVCALAQQQISDDELRERLKTKIRLVETLAFNPTLIEAVRRQNAENLSMDTIRQRDEEWQKDKALTLFKRSLQVNKAGRVLQSYVTRNAFFNEAFLTDNKGANVAVYPLTSDYWQGDEEKFSAAFNDGEGKTYLGPLEKDESTQSIAVQVSVPVIDQKKAIGVLVVGVTESYLEKK